VIAVDGYGRFRHYIDFFWREINKSFTFIFVLAGIASLLEGIGLTLLIPLLNQAVSTTDESIQSMAIIPKIFNVIGLSMTVQSLSFCILTAIFVKALFMMASGYYSAAVKAGFTRHYRIKLFDRLSHLDLINMKVRGVGEFSGLMTEQVNRLTGMLDSLIKGIILFINAIVYLGIAVFLSPIFGLFVLAFGAIAGFFFRYQENLLLSNRENIWHLFYFYLINHFNNLYF
jgi:ABC-type multidrug transport system fused ATPase/permease subunit